MTKPTLALLGTSNCVMRGGIANVLEEYFAVANHSIGACGSGIGLYEVASDPAILESDFVLLDYTINDNEHIARRWQDTTHVMDAARTLYAMVARSDAIAAVLVMPTWNYLDKAYEQAGVVLHRKLARTFGFPVYDGYDFLQRSRAKGTEALFLDNAHLQRSVARTFGRAVAEDLLRRPVRKEDPQPAPRETQKEAVRVLGVADFVHDGTEALKGSSVVKKPCVTIEQGQTITLRVKDGLDIIGFVLNANSKSKLRLEFDGGRRIVKDIYSGALADDKVQFRYVPLQVPVNSSSLTIRIAPFDEEVTERSPRFKKTLSEDGYGSADIFAVLTARFAPEPMGEPEHASEEFPAIGSYGLDVQMEMLGDLERMVARVLARDGGGRAGLVPALESFLRERGHPDGFGDGESVDPATAPAPSLSLKAAQEGAVQMLRSKSATDVRQRVLRPENTVAPGRKALSPSIGPPLAVAARGAAGGEAKVAALFRPSDKGLMLDATDPSSLRTTRGGSGEAVAGGPVGAWIDKRAMGGRSVAAYMAENGLATPLAAPGVHLVAASDAARPLRSAYGVTPDGQDDRLNAALGFYGTELYIAARYVTAQRSGYLSQTVVGVGTNTTASSTDTSGRLSVTPSGSSLTSVLLRGSATTFDAGLGNEDVVVEALFRPTSRELVVNRRASTGTHDPALGAFDGHRVGLLGDIRETASPSNGLCSATPVKRVLVLSRIPSSAEREIIRSWLAG